MLKSGDCAQNPHFSGRQILLFELAAEDTVGLSKIRAVNVAPDSKSYAYTYERALSELYLVEDVK